jgi:hypothetical protein
MSVLLAALSYFGLLFALGFVLGPIRVFKLTPRFGKLGAILIEAPVMLLAMPWAARWAIHQFSVPPEGQLWMGLIALLLLSLADYGVATRLMHQSLPRYFQQMATPAGWVGIVLKVVFAGMPTCMTPLLMQVGVLGVPAKSLCYRMFYGNRLPAKNRQNLC